MTILEAQSSLVPKVVLLLSGRGSPLLSQRQRLQTLAGQLGLAVVGEQVFRRRRRGGVGEQLRSALPVGVTVVIERLTALAKDPLTALLAAAEIRSMGIALVSAEEPWLLEIGALLPALGGWLQGARRDQRREVTRAALSRARAGGRKIGRPRRNLGDLNAVVQLCAAIGIARGARQLQCGETTLRRWISARPSPQPTQSFSPAPPAEAEGAQQ